MISNAVWPAAGVEARAGGGEEEDVAMGRQNSSQQEASRFPKRIAEPVGKLRVAAKAAAEFCGA